MEKIIEEYRKHAEDCRAMAASMNYPDLRAEILKLADFWDHLANEREMFLGMNTKRNGT